MRNQSEHATPIRPAQAMNDRTICTVLASLTVKTKFRVWFDDLDKLFNEHDHTYERHECTELSEYEVEAAKVRRSVDYTVHHVDHEEEVAWAHSPIHDGELHFEGAGARFDRDGSYGIFAITILEPGLPQAVDTCIGGYDCFADPADNAFYIDQLEFDESETIELHSVVSQWLRARGHIS